MTKPEPKFDWSALDAEMERIQSTCIVGEERPKGTFTREEFGKHRGLRRSASSANIKRLCDMGIIEPAGFFQSDTQRRTKLYRYRAKQSVR